jgi:hypothetical protein
VNFNDYIKGIEHKYMSLKLENDALKKENERLKRQKHPSSDMTTIRAVEITTQTQAVGGIFASLFGQSKDYYKQLNSTN